MGKLGRFACIFTPMALTIASLICLLLVFMGGLNKSDSNLRSIYYAKADLSQFTANVSIGNINENNISDFFAKLGIKNGDVNLAKALLSANAKSDIKDVYYIYMWNYCSGSIGKDNKTETITYCSPRKAQFYFNPIEEWGLNNTLAQSVVPKGIDGALNAYKKGAQWMFIAYAVAFWTTVAAIVVGLFSICSRVGSCITTVVASAATLFTFLAALTSTILFSTLVGGMNGVLKPYKVNMSVGTKMLAVDWLAVAFSVGATLFWTISICCCSGRSDKKNRGSKHSDYSNVSAPGTGYGFGSRGYQPLGEHHGSGAVAGNHGTEMQNFGTAGPYKGRETAYEPFRHERV